WAVASSEWAVGGGQWAVRRSHEPHTRLGQSKARVYSSLPTAHCPLPTAHCPQGGSYRRKTSCSSEFPGGTRTSSPAAEARRAGNSRDQRAKNGCISP